MNLVIKGFIIGIGKIAPGISGAMIAMTLNEYDRIIESIANIKKNIYDNTKYLSKIGIGICLAIILMSKIIVKSLTKHYFATILLFTSIISKGLLDTIKEIKLKKKDIIISIIAILAIYLILKICSTSKITIKKSKSIQIIELTIMGIIDSIASIVPGISGTTLLMYFGYYEKIITAFSMIPNLSTLKDNIKILLPFIAGFLLGTLLTAKILNKMIKKYPNIVKITISILMTYTVSIMIKTAINTRPNIKEIMIGILLCIFVIKTKKKNIIK